MVRTLTPQSPESRLGEAAQDLCTWQSLDMWAASLSCLASAQTRDSPVAWVEVSSFPSAQGLGDLPGELVCAEVLAEGSPDKVSLGWPQVLEPKPVLFQEEPQRGSRGGHGAGVMRRKPRGAKQGRRLHTPQGHGRFPRAWQGPALPTS